MSKKFNKRIPVEGEFMKRKYNDNVYGWLQYNSFADAGKTLVPKYLINDLEPWKEIYKEFALSGQKRKFRDEIKKYRIAGFIKDATYKKGNNIIDCFELVYDEKELYYLMSDRVLEYMVNTKSCHSIRTLCYLTFKFKNNPRYTFTKKELIINVLGSTSIHNKHSYKIIDDVLFDLEQSGFIGINHEKYISLNDKATKVKQILWINLLPMDLKEYFERKKR